MRFRDGASALQDCCGPQKGPLPLKTKLNQHGHVAARFFAHGWQTLKSIPAGRPFSRASGSMRHAAPSTREVKKTKTRPLKTVKWDKMKLKLSK